MSSVGTSSNSAGIRIIVSTEHAVGAGARNGEPFSIGVPLPRGLARGDERWAWRASDGAARPAQTRVMDRWSDGSVRWLLACGQVAVPGSGRSDLWLQIGADPLPCPDAVAVSESPAGVDIQTGAAQFRLAPGTAVPFATAMTPVAKDSPACSVTLEEQSGATSLLTIDRVTVGERGPLRATAILDGAFRRDGQVVLTARMVLEFYAGLPTVRALLTVTNPEAAGHPEGFWDLGASGAVYVKELALKCQLAAASVTSVDYSAEPEQGWQLATPSFEIYQDSSGGELWNGSNHMNRRREVPARFRGYRLRTGGVERSGLRATPIVVARGAATVAAAATLPQFWQNCPKAVDVADDMLKVAFFPRQYSDVHEIQGGEQKTHELFLSFGADRVTEHPLEWARAQAYVHVDPQWVCDSGAVAWLSPAEPTRRALIDAAIEGPDTFEHKREVVDQYGWRHFGEVYGDHEGIRRKQPPPLVSHYNNQYDTLAGFTYQYLATGDRRWWTMMHELAWHVLDIDIYHTDRDRSVYNRGMFWHTYHYGDADTAGHRTHPRAGKGETHGGGPSADHNYTTGLMLQYFMTGDELMRQAVIDLAQYVIDLDDGGKNVLKWLSRSDTGKATASEGYRYHGPGRGPANSLNALLDGHRITADSRFLQKAESLLRRVVHPADDIDTMELDEPERRWFYSMFLQSLGKYLDYKAERGELDAMYAYGRESLLHYARWMAEHEYPYLDKPEKLTFPTETWAAQDIRKSDIFYFAAMHASGPERERFLERASFFFDNSIETLAKAPTRTLARPVIVLLSSGRLHSWFAKHLNGVAPPPQWSDQEFGTPSTFVSQKEQATQRLKMVAAAAVVVVVVVAVWLIR